MKKLLRSRFGTLVVAAFLAMTPLTYTRGGHGGGHGVKHAAAGHVKGGHAAFRGRGGRGHHFVDHARGRARYAGRAYYATRGGNWGGYYGYPYYGYSGYSLSYCGLGYSYPYYGYWPYLGLSFGFNGY